MTTETKLSLPAAASHFGVPLRVLRRAIRKGALPAPENLTATSFLPAGWLASAAAALHESPKALNRNLPQKAPPFAHYKGTSAWRKYATRVRDHARFQATNKK